MSGVNFFFFQFGSRFWQVKMYVGYYSKSKFFQVKQQRTTKWQQTKDKAVAVAGELRPMLSSWKKLLQEASQFRNFWTR